MTRDDFDLWLRDGQRRTLVMGVLNVTPDSFSDGAKFADVDAAVAHAREMIRDGADVIDIGGESTRPGALPVDSAEQIRRVAPVISAIKNLGVMISIDTTRADVAAAALDAGAAMINDISGGRDDAAMLPLAAERRVPIVLMHMQGTPATMQNDPTYQNVVGEIVEFLYLRRDAAIKAGCAPDNILLDPGLGFGKKRAHNFQLLRALRLIADALPAPLVVGVSRKKFIGDVTDEPIASQRIFGTAAAVAWCAANGAGVVRVHDVKAMKQVVATIESITRPE